MSSSSTIEIEISDEDDYDNFPHSRLKKVDTFIESDSNLEIGDFNELESESEDEQIEQNTLPLQSISCAAHTFQLAIHDILYNDE